MSDAAAPTSLDIAEQVARVLRSNEETQKFVAEQKTLMAEAAKYERDRAISVWQVAVSCLAAGAALFGAGVAFIKLLGP